MAINVLKPARAEMAKCVARFGDLARCETGLPDMQLPDCQRTFLNVLGFSQPKDEDQFSPFGDLAPSPICAPASVWKNPT